MHALAGTADGVLNHTVSGLGGLPDGTFVLRDGEPWLVRSRELLRWTPAGYAGRAPRPSGEAELLTPSSLVEVLRAGWEPLVPLLHPSA